MVTSAEKIALEIFEKCAGRSGCGVCRPHMEDDCLFFPELYRLQDQSEDLKTSISTRELHHLIDLCTMCGLCPCPDIRTIILKAKTVFADKQRFSPSGRLITDIQMTRRWTSKFDTLVNPLLKQPLISAFVKNVIKIHKKRALPTFPTESFFLWAKKRGITFQSHNNNSTSKVAYFAGCSAGYLFPEVGKAVVNILEQNNVEVYVPPQECCGMPLIMEGAQKTALKKIRSNIENLLQAEKNGYTIVSSCPTCGYFLKNLLLENAYYSDAYQAVSGAGPDIMKVPSGSKNKSFSFLSKKIYSKILVDDGYFSTVDPLKRIELSQKVMDVGQFLLSIQTDNNLKIKSEFLNKPLVYYAPCHQRELEIGQPYYSLFSSLPGIDIINIGGVMDCCGMGGHLGFKSSFYSQSLQIGQSLFEKLLTEKDRTIITDCLSCRMQLEHVLTADVLHPVELLR